MELGFDLYLMGVGSQEMGKGWISHSKCWTEWEEVLVGSQCNGVSQSCSARLEVFRLAIRNFGKASEGQGWAFDVAMANFR